MRGDDRRTGEATAQPDDDDRPVLPEVSSDETPESWGDRRDERDDDWYRRERPPHWE